MAMHRKATDLRHSLACVSCRIVSVCSNSERLAYMCTPSVSACAVEVKLHGFSSQFRGCLGHLFHGRSWSWRRIARTSQLRFQPGE
jgi:hypothetical protein